jgi:chromosome segregation ATPase
VKSVLIEMKESLDSVIADYEKEKKQMDDRRERFDADIANKVAVAEKRVNEKNIIIDGLVTHSEALKRSIDLLIKDKNMLSEEVKKLADKKTAIISIIDGLSVDAKELSAGVDSLNAEINRKRTELESVSNNYINLNNQCILLKSQIEALSVEKQDILNAKEENSRRAKELQEMYEDIRIEKIAQANKNASLLKREAAIKEAQTKIGG